MICEYTCKSILNTLPLMQVVTCRTLKQRATIVQMTTHIGRGIYFMDFMDKMLPNSKKVTHLE